MKIRIKWKSAQLIFIVLILLSILLSGCDSSSNPPFSNPVILPSQITNVQCGSTATVQINAYYRWSYEMLCWGRTNYDTNWVKLTDSCISGPRQLNDVLNINLRSSPAYYQETLYIQCRMYYTLGQCNPAIDFTGSYNVTPPPGYTFSSIFPLTISCNYCGDGRVSAGEDCDGINLGNNTCNSLGFGTGTLRCNSQCRFDTSLCANCGNGIAEFGETSANCCQDAGCGSDQTCVSNGASNVCKKDNNQYCSLPTECASGFCVSGLCSEENWRSGDRKCDREQGENCANSQNDCTVKSGYVCDPNGREVQCYQDDHCAYLSQSAEINKKECSADNKKIILKENFVIGYCDQASSMCKQKMENRERFESCQSNTFCQDGKCGCSEGYEACGILGKCTKTKSVQINQPCGCDFQCAEGYCDKDLKQCTKGVYLKFSTTKEQLSVGEEATLTFSAINPTSKEVQADLSISLGNGLEISEVISGDICSGNQCKLAKVTIDPNNKKDVSIRVKAVSKSDTTVNANIAYGPDRKYHEIEEKLNIEIVQCGNGILEKGETQQNCCMDTKCPADTGLYEYTCNQYTGSCQKKMHDIIIFTAILAGFIFILTIVIIIYFILRP